MQSKPRSSTRRVGRSSSARWRVGKLEPGAPSSSSLVCSTAARALACLGLGLGIGLGLGLGLG